MKIAISYLKSQYDRKETIKRIESTTADYIHVDLMDGRFVEKDNMDLENLFSVLKETKKPLDIHLMSIEVLQYIQELKCLNLAYITFHLEAPLKTLEVIKKIKEMGSEVGLAIKPNTPITELEPYFEQVDLILVMSVEPGLGGQKFLESSLEKLKELKKYQEDYHFSISIDGGINDMTIKKVRPYVDMVVSGSFVCESNDYEAQIKKLR